MRYFKKHKDIIVFNYIVVAIYIVVFNYLNVEITEKLMFSTVDSRTYWLTGFEFYKFSEKGYSEFRPFLYPLIIMLLHKVVGLYGIWLMQFFLWATSINLVFFAIQRVTNSRALSFCGGFIIAVNISFIVLTVNALTESISIFLLSLLICFLSYNTLRIKSIKTFHGCLLIVVLLTVIKPILYIYILLMLFVVLPFFYLKKYVEKPKNLFLLLLCLTPLLFQITIMKTKYNTFSISNIDSESLRAYLLAQGVQQNNSVGLAEAREITKEMETSEVLSYLMDNKMLYIRIYLQNLKNAIMSEPCFIMYPNSFYQPEVISYMKFINAFYFFMHIVFFIPVMTLVYYSLRKKDIGFHSLPLIFVVLLTYYILLLTGFSFNEGDRHGIISLPLWLFLYTLVIDVYYKKVRNMKPFTKQGSDH